MLYLGTTTLSIALHHHDQFCDDAVKEKKFNFDPAAKEMYSKRFPLKCQGLPDMRTLDATPNYLSQPDIPGKVKAFYSPEELASKKFIVILREPVARMVRSNGLNESRLID